MRSILVCAVLLIAACHDKRPPAPTAEQSSQLNDAENMLNGMANEEGANEEGPADRSTGPSNSSD